jgi:hypothetical protein
VSLRILKMARKPKKLKNVETLKHEDARRANIPTAEYQSVMADEEKSPIRVAYERRNRDLDPQLVWRARMGRIGAIWSYPRRRFIFKKRFTPRRSLTTYYTAARRGPRLISRSS